MVFNSFEFLLFFPIVTLLYFLLPHKFRWLLLLAASCIFYMYFIPKYILILFFTIIVDYILGILIENKEGVQRKQLLVFSIIANVGVLCVFKYFNFFIQNIEIVLHSFHINKSLPVLNIIMPLGLSFHTFQAMSYTIEVYKGRQKAERHLGIYALYVMFYPQLVAGPIERPQNVMHQFHEKHAFSFDNLSSGLKMMIWGFFKKVVVADRLALIVAPVYANPQKYEGVSLFIATLFFAFQIYCDFSAYSDIARGAARVMGYKLMVNFNRPIWARSLSDFWNRWHISLSSWFRDYLFVPLGGYRTKRWRIFVNLTIVLLISGLWHGANWTYIVWGAIHSFYIFFGLLTRKARGKMLMLLNINPKSKFGDFLAILSTFGLSTFAMIFFRAQTLQDGVYIVKHLLTGWGALLSVSKLKVIIENLTTAGLLVNTVNLLMGAVLIVFYEYIEYKGQKQEIFEFNKGKSTLFRWAYYYLLLICIVVIGVYGHEQFIYNQF